MKAQHTTSSRMLPILECVYTLSAHANIVSLYNDRSIGLISYYLSTSFLFSLIYIIYKNLALAVYFRLINSDGRAHETGSIVIALTDGQKREVVKY